MSTKDRLLLVERLMDEIMHDESEKLTMHTIGLMTEAKRDVELVGKHLGVGSA